MTWNIAPECISTVFLCIIWIYSRKGNLIPNLKNRLFQVSFMTTFCAMTTNILSTILIYWLSQETLLITWIVTNIYFAATPLMGVVYFYYTLANIYDNTKKLKLAFIISGIPSILYILLVATNPITKLLFDITVENGYVQGSLISVTYIVFYIYCVVSVILVAFQGKRVAPVVRAILICFPAIAGLVIVIQFIQPNIILSGSAATCAILIIYLYLQNKQISIDYLTHIPNRHEFLKMLEVYLRRKYSFSIIVISLREFKNINDIHGQQSGDNLLSALSGYLRKEFGLREGELYRYSGDEFAMLLKDGSEAVLKPIVERILERMAHAWEVPGCKTLLLASLGIVNYPKTSDDMAGLLNGLEYAVSIAKADNENYGVCYCTPGLLDASKRRHIIVEELEEQLEADGFEIHYQPIYSVEGSSFIKAEALLRMPSKRLERVFPDEFIPIAEESGLIIDITYLVLNKVCRFIRRLENDGIELESINVNFSAVQFSQRDLIPRMLQIMNDNGVAYSKIKVEITESALAENTEAVSTCLHQLSEYGVKMGLDDFGTGYSNLISVLALPIDTVKLDKSVVWSAEKNERCSIALQNFARAFRELGMTVLAEGVETEAQQRLVVDAGCTLIQGFLYARPMPEEKFVEFLKEKQGGVS